MISKYVQEQKRYTYKEICELFEEDSEEKTLLIIRKLKEYGILKLVRATAYQKDLTDLIEGDIQIADIEAGENEYYYVFTFVGIITVASKILKCYPKYIKENKEPKQELKQIIRVLEKYNSKEQIIHMYNGEDESKSFNLLAMQMFLLNDYYENGLYTNMNDVIETNGQGEVVWDNTINDTFAILNNDRPYYMELKTKRNIENDLDFFKQLHEYILSEISKELKDADLLDLFDIIEVELINEDTIDFEDKDYILYRIESELSIQFNSRKQLILKAMYTYIKQSAHLYDLECFSMFGTNRFNLVWEKVCADVFDNKLNCLLKDLKLPIELDDKYNKNMKVIDLIEKPLWSIPNARSSETFIPDIISNDITNGKCYFAILDAKYYNTVLEEGGIIRGVPGIESISKQYLYQLSYMNFIKKHSFEKVYNCFLMPTEKDKVIDKGVVSLDMLDEIGLNKIQIREIPAQNMYLYYTKNKKMTLEELDLKKDSEK